MVGLIRCPPGAGGLSDEQFYSFANYVNEIIVHSLGYINSPQITLMMKQQKWMESKMLEFHTTGPLFGFDD